MLSDLYIRLRSLFRRSKVEEELDDEMRFHIQKQTEKYMHAGMSREEAQRQVRLDFGGIDQVKEDCRDARGVSLVETVSHDLRYAMGRPLRLAPGSDRVACQRHRWHDRSGSVLACDAALNGVSGSW